MTPSLLCPTCKDDDCVESVRHDNCTACGWAQFTPLDKPPSTAGCECRPEMPCVGCVENVTKMPTPAKCEHNYGALGVGCMPPCDRLDVAPEAEAGRPLPKTVEEMIEELVEFFGAKGARNTNEAIRKIFRELVALVRGERK